MSGRRPASEIREPRGAVPDAGWSRGEDLIADHLAQSISEKAGVSRAAATAQVAGERGQGRGWGEIARGSGLDVGEVARIVKRVAETVGSRETAGDGSASRLPLGAAVSARSGTEA
jgi:hypothetical protein